MSAYWTLVIGFAPAFITWVLADLFKVEGKTKAMLVTVAAIIVSGGVLYFTKNEQIAMIVLTSIGASGTVDGFAKNFEKAKTETLIQ